MAKFIDVEEAVSELKKLIEERENFSPRQWPGGMSVTALKFVIGWLEKRPVVEPVSKGLFDQIRRERDIAIEQLADYGIALGEKAEVAKVVHARWEFVPSKKYKFCYDAICSACKNVIDSHHENCLEYRQTAIQKKLRRCPTCGAIMDGKCNVSRMDGDGNG